jgi:UDP-N-acetyl-2-amino-2-deoxyglucuronate dehydrogenase
MVNFALLGAAGFVAPRHLQAIKATGNRLIAACDPHDSVGVIDAFFPDAAFFTEVERFDRFLEKVRRRGPGERVHFVSICSPNYLHDAHVRLALRVGASAICEKPLVINPWNLDPLAELERETQGRVYTVMQLRLIPSLLALREALRREGGTREVELSYVTRRGRWYHVSWKGSEEKSGGLAVNIGIHLFDLLLWLFGPAHVAELHLAAPDRLGGYLELARARVRWFLSVNVADLPPEVSSLGRPSYRSLSIDGQRIEFSDGFGDLHTRVYEHVLGGGGFGIDEARPSIELASRIRRSPVALRADRAHPQVIELARSSSVDRS